MLVIGLDIGGANLKAATSDGHATSRAFPLWKHPNQLVDELKQLISELPAARALAVTMTGELADCFQSKEEGVGRIITAVEQAAEGTPCWFWHTGGEFLSPDEARDCSSLVAAANWHVLATFCTRILANETAILIDIGSTTTDIIPLREGRIDSEGLTDPERLAASELVYTGAARTPLCALGPTLTWQGVTYGIAAEFFATVRDIYIILGEESESPSDCETADGRPATREYAARRVARMLCADPEELDSIEELAELFALQQRRRIADAFQTVARRVPECRRVLLAGSGSHIAKTMLQEFSGDSAYEITDIEAMFARRVSEAACAFAVARLGAERLF